MIFVAAVFLLSTAVHSPAMAQDGYLDDSQDQAVPVQPSLRETRQGQIARSAAGQAGQRQTRDAVAAEAGIEPMGRINGRIQNRVQSRIRNRIDRYYDPQANTTAPFAVASDQARATGRPRR